MRIDRLKEVRERRKISQQDLADRIGSSQRQIARYESGENDPASEVIASIARALEVSVDYLVGLVDAPSDHFTDDDLTPMERRLIWAVRNGLIVEAYKTTTAIFEAGDQSNITPNQKAVNG